MSPVRFSPSTAARLCFERIKSAEECCRLRFSADESLYSFPLYSPFLYCRKVSCHICQRVWAIFGLMLLGLYTEEES